MKTEEAFVQAKASPRLMLGVLLTAQAMAAMDTSIANVAGPSIRADLGLSSAALQVVLAGYNLAYAMALITCARLGDDFGYRRAFIWGVSLFTSSSLFCGIARATWLLVGARVLQGVGAALLAPQVLSMIQREFEGPARARAVGRYSAVLALATTGGQILGGVVVSVDLMGLSWRPAFLINVPIGVTILALARSALPDTRGTKRKLDVGGVALLSVSIMSLIIPLVFGRAVHWAPWTWASILLGTLGVAGFVTLEKGVARRGGFPLVDFEVLSPPGVKAGLGILFDCCAIYGGLLFTVALFLQSGLGFSPLGSGLVFTSFALGFGVANLTWSKFSREVLRWIPTAALAGSVAVYSLFSLAASHWLWAPAVMLPLLFVGGANHGFAFGPTMHQLTLRVKPAQASALSGLSTTTLQLGIAAGITCFGTIYTEAATQQQPAPVSAGISVVSFAIGGLALLTVLLTARVALTQPAPSR